MKHEAFKKVGIFRLAGEATVISGLRKKMDKKEFVDDEDVFSVATLLKVRFFSLLGIFFYVNLSLVGEKIWRENVGKF